MLLDDQFREGIRPHLSYLSVLTQQGHRIWPMQALNNIADVVVETCGVITSHSSSLCLHIQNRVRRCRSWVLAGPNVDLVPVTPGPGTVAEICGQTGIPGPPPHLNDPPRLSCSLRGWDGGGRGVTEEEGKEKSGVGAGEREKVGSRRVERRWCPPPPGLSCHPRISARHVMIMGFQVSRSLRGSLGWGLGLGLEALVSLTLVMM